MKETDLLAAMSFVGEDLIQEAEQKSKRPHLRRAAGLITAAVLALVLMALPVTPPDIAPDEGDAVELPQDTDTLQINWLESASSAEADMDLRIDVLMDGIIVCPPNGTPLQGEDMPLEHHPNIPYVLPEFSAAAGVDHEAFFTLLCERFQLNSYYLRRVRTDKDDEAYSLIHDHCLELSTENGGWATLSVSREGWPLRCYLIDSDAPLRSTVQSVEMVIHGMRLPDRTMFFTRFENDGVWYDIETESISEDELLHLLETLVGCRSSESDT